MSTEPRRRRARRPPPEKEFTHGSGAPLDSKGRKMCTDHQDPGKGQPCPTCGRCHAHSSQTGDPCRRWPVPGGGVCVTHGGSTTNARKAFARRMLAMVDPAMERLGKIIDDDSVPPRDHIRATTVVFDRAGLGPSSKIEVETPKWQEAFEAAIIVNEPGDPIPDYALHRYDTYDPEEDADDPDE